MFEEYQKLAGKSIEDSIKSETKGSLEDAMLAIGKCPLSLSLVQVCCLSSCSTDSIRWIYFIKLSSGK